MTCGAGVSPAQAAGTAAPQNFGTAWRTGVLLAALSLVFAGCGSTGPAIVSVSGKVCLDGKPLGEGRVSFASSSGYATSALLQPDGTFRLVTQYGEGIPPGTYRVAILLNPTESVSSLLPTATHKPSTAIPAKYQYLHSSDLKAVVTVDNCVYNFDLTTK